MFLELNGYIYLKNTFTPRQEFPSEFRNFFGVNHCGEWEETKRGWRLKVNYLAVSAFYINKILQNEGFNVPDTPIDTNIWTLLKICDNQHDTWPIEKKKNYELFIDSINNNAIRVADLIMKREIDTESVEFKQAVKDALQFLEQTKPEINN